MQLTIGAGGHTVPWAVHRTRGRRAEEYFDIMQHAAAFAVTQSEAMTPVAPELTVIVPTFNEAENVPVLVDKLERVLDGQAWEVIFVDDDSADGTAAVVSRLGAKKPHVRCLKRIGRRGLSSAVIDGVACARGDFVAVMDADLQHDERLLTDMLIAFEDEGIDLAIGSRYVGGGGVGEWSRFRHGLSKVATKLSRLVVDAPLHDPMSGFFMIRRAAFAAVVDRLSGAGYKILLDVIASSPRPLRFVELPYEFRPRVHGQSKVNARVFLDYLVMIVEKRAAALGRRA